MSAAAQRVRELVNASRMFEDPDDDLTTADLVDDSAARWALPAAIGSAELSAARLTPRCIVENYLFADVGALIGPGGTSKTTAALHESVCIVLGLPMWGLAVVTAGPVLIVTAEDRREFLVARLREVCRAMNLSPAQTTRVREMVRIDDRTVSRRRLTMIVKDIVEVSAFAHDIVAGCKAEGFAPVLVQFDPLVSFGVGEARVNDAEQGAIDALRVIVAGLDCCVRVVHHSGKAGAREKIADMYAGRGGSALADGCRMVAVMQPADAAEVAKATGRTLGADESAVVLHRPKVSHAPPQNDRPLYIVRKGYLFELAAPLAVEDRRAQDEARDRERDSALRGALLDAADAAWRTGLPLAQRGLVEAVKGFKTDAKREALGRLLGEGWLHDVRVPPGWRLVNNARRTYIVRLTADDRDALRKTGALPVDKLTPPPSIATPPEATQ